jgi:2-keto-4-pentenoate hydratase/2-oxohepta-3-ene-1,7-dioic acid hydratase in catechol pathway
VKLISFVASGRQSYGAVAGDGVVDLGRRFGGRFPTLRTAIAANAQAEFAAALQGAERDLSLAGISLLPPIPDPEKILCAGRNYRGHAAEGGAKVPEFPSLFVRLANTLVAAGGAIVVPRISSDLDYEGELAVIIGKPGRHVKQAEALSHVLGYSCFNDASVRDFQFKHSLTTGKNFVATGGFGPWIVTADEIPDPTQLHLTTRLNGTEVQHTRTDDLIFDIPTLISYISDFTPLAPGDVIATGTPEGVGWVRKPPLWMKAGDVVEVEVSGVGLLRNPIVAE